MIATYDYNHLPAGQIEIPNPLNPNYPFRVDSAYRNLQRAFGDSVHTSLRLPLPYAMTVECGGTQIKSMYLYAGNLPNSATFSSKNPYSVGASLPVAQLWINGTDTLMTHTDYAPFTLHGGKKVLLPLMEKFGRPRKITAMSRITAYSEYMVIRCRCRVISTRE